jgi:MSHA biogenesis protein MshM
MLRRNELDRYVDHRLNVAGHRGESLFTPSARRALYRYSGGTPRLVNILAHKALLAAFGEGRAKVGKAHVVGAAGDTEGAMRVPWWKLAW